MLECEAMTSEGVEHIPNQSEGVRDDVWVRPVHHDNIIVKEFLALWFIDKHKLKVTWSDL